MRVIAGIFILLLIAGCAGSSPIPRDHFYRLPDPTLQSEPVQIVLGDIFVEQFITDGLHRERAILYTNDPLSIELGQYHYHHWIDSPTRLIRDQLIQFLRVSNVASRVYDTPDVSAGLHIYGKIRRFERQHNEASDSIIVSLDLRVMQSGLESPLLLKLYTEQIDFEGQSMNKAVVAFAEALSIIFSHLIEDIKQNLVE